MNWIKQVGKKITTDLHVYYLPRRIVAVIPKVAMENNTILLNKSEDDNNIYLEFQIKDALEITKDNSIATGRKEITSSIH
jgi:hypothetical protein